MLTFFGAIWNLFLLSIPFSIALLLEKKLEPKNWRNFSIWKKILGSLLILVFFIFFPNIPYIFTDSRHIFDFCSGEDLYVRCPEAPWSIIVYFTYSALAIPFFVLSLEKMSSIFSRIFHPLWKELLPLALIPLSALGVCLGLFERWNSWDAFGNLRAVIQSAVSYFLVPEKFFLFLTFSGCLFVIFYFFRFFFAGAKKEFRGPSGSGESL